MQEALQRELAELEALAGDNSDRNGILDIFHRYIHYHSLLHIEGTLGTFASREDISLELGDEGVVVGRERLRQHFGFMPKLAAKPGVMLYQYTTCPVVEIAADRASAKLTCFSPGLDAMAPALLQHWIYGKYHVDLVREADGWKLWHVRWFRTFDTPVTVGWLNCQNALDEEKRHPALADAYSDPAPREPGSYPADWAYPTRFDPAAVNYLLPEPPQPYASWNGNTSGDKTRSY